MQMKINSAPRRTNGFSLLEVLVAVVILSFGLLALAALQAGLIRSSSEAKAQSVGLALAKDKLEELRGYRCLTGCTPSYANIATGNDTVTDVGGSTGGVDFTRSWAVKRYVLPSAGGGFCAAGATGCTTGFAPNSEFKTVDIRVGWTDATGQARVVALEDAIAGLDPTDTARNVSIRRAAPRGPKVIIYDPSTEDGVIPIAVGNGSETAATNPKPVNVSRTGDDAIETRFDVLTYSALTGGTALAQAKVETSVVGCTCTNTATSTTGYRPTYWDGYRYVPPQQASVNATARAATGVTQSRYCTVCCRDHHDDGVAAGDPKFSPRSSDMHKHYKLVSSVLTIAGANDNYLESCRLIRVDGIFDVAADLSNDYYNLLPTANGSSSPQPSESSPDAVTNYQNFVLNYLKERYSVPNPSVGTASSTYNNRTSPNPASTAGTTLDLPSPIEISAAATATTDQNTKWLNSRGLYIDFLEQSALDRIGDAKANCAAPGTPTATQLRDCVLRALPFTSINLTELADWSPVAGQQIKVTATSDFSTSIDFTDPIRGKVTQGTGPTPNSTQDATTKVASGNSGVAVMPDINPDDITSESETNMNDNQTFRIINSSGGPAGGTFHYAIAGYGANALPDTGYTYGGRSDVCSDDPLTPLVIDITCATRQSETLPAPVTVRIANYNRSFTGIDGDTITNPCKAQKSTYMDYRAVYDVTGVTYNYGSALVTGLKSVNNNQVTVGGSIGEYSEALVTSIYNDAPTNPPANPAVPRITFTFSAPTYRCPINQVPNSFVTSTQCGGNNGQDPIWDWGGDGTGAVCTSGGGTSPPNNP